MKNSYRRDSLDAYHKINMHKQQQKFEITADIYIKKS